MVKINKALMFSGTGSLFAQEIAAIDHLINTGRFIPNASGTVLVASGFGALNLLAINACFSSISTLKWNEDYKSDFLNNITTDDIYIKTDPVYWNTLPQRELIKQLLRKCNFSRLGDLPFDSRIIVAENSDIKTKWLHSSAKKFENVSISDVLMATSAIPVVFPPIVLNSVNEMPIDVKDGAFIEGAKNGLFKKFKKQLKKMVAENGPLDELYILSPTRTNEIIDFGEYQLHGMSVEDRSVFLDFWKEVSLNQLLDFLSDLEFLNRKKKIAAKIYVTIPEVYSNYKILAFDNLLEIYTDAYNWFDKNKDRLTIDLVTFNKEYSCLV